MKPFLLILLLSACQLLSIVASAQTPAAKYLNFSLITISDGLSQGMVTCMLQDHFGFMWFGTKDGLNRYDGFKFVVYRHDANDNTTIADNFIKAIYEDNAGRLWVGTAGRGADMFDRSTETFFHFEHDEKNNASLSDNRVNKITGDRFGNIWVSTYNGLNKIAAGMLHNQSSKQVYSSLKITRYFKDECLFTEVSDGTIWGSSLHYGSYHIHPLSKDSVQIDTLDMGLYCSYPQEDKGLEKIIRLIVEDTINHALYLVAEYSIARVDMKSNEVKIVSM
ncbi:MAG: two-component regulator propeller domain-containing protein, partial [Dokdonella sp.]|uniref:ligand-binding sensor domain-containing protein n=1 Tax=Dokdonella sp. TaxID=2291710 RepID=UPI003BAF5BF1